MWRTEDDSNSLSLLLSRVQSIPFPWIWTGPVNLFWLAECSRSDCVTSKVESYQICSLHFYHLEHASLKPSHHAVRKLKQQQGENHVKQNWGPKTTAVAELQLAADINCLSGKWGHFGTASHPSASTNTKNCPGNLQNCEKQQTSVLRYQIWGCLVEQLTDNQNCSIRKKRGLILPRRVRIWDLR